MIVGGVSYVLSEQISYSFTKEFSWSDAQFVGNLLGGAIGGGLSIIPFFGPIFVSFLTGFLSTGIGMHLQNKWEGKNYTKDEILFASFANGAISALAFKFFELIKIPGLTSGKGSYKAISKQISTKFIRGIISSISFKTFSKIFTYNLAGTFTGILCSGLMDAINANDLLVDFYNRRPLDYF